MKTILTFILLCLFSGIIKAQTCTDIEFFSDSADCTIDLEVPTPIIDLPCAILDYDITTDIPNPIFNGGMIIADDVPIGDYLYNTS